MNNDVKIYEVCEKPIKECICCPECSHICSLEHGEYYCPVCFPKKNNMDEYYMHIALKEAKAALTKGEVPVGAVLVSGNRVIATAHNKKEVNSDPTAHAELTVIREGAIETGNWRLKDAILYVTKEPCVMCAGAMVNARLGKLVYGCNDNRYGAVKSQYHIASDPVLNHQVEIVSGVLENDCADLLRKFFKMRRVRLRRKNRSLKKGKRVYLYS